MTQAALAISACKRCRVIQLTIRWSDSVIVTMSLARVCSYLVNSLVQRFPSRAFRLLHLAFSAFNDRLLFDELTSQKSISLHTDKPVLCMTGKENIIVPN